MAEKTVNEGELIKATSLKAGDVIKNQLTEKTYEYIKVNGISRCKTGKHGAAKIIVEGNEVRTRTFRKLALTGGDYCKKVNFKRATYQLLDFLESEDIIMFEVPDANNKPEAWECNIHTLEPETLAKLKVIWRNFLEKRPTMEPVDGNPPSCEVKVVLWEDGTFFIDEN